MKKENLTIKLPELYLYKLLKLSILKDKSPNELIAQAFAIFYMKEMENIDKTKK